MTPQEFKAARAILGLSQSQMAAVMGLTGGARVIFRYENSGKNVPGYVAVMVRYLTRHGLDREAKAALGGRAPAHSAKRATLSKALKKARAAGA